MKIFLIEDDAQVSSILRPLLQTRFLADVLETSSLQEAIELLEGPWEASDLIICDYHGKGSALMKCLLGLCPKVPCIFVIDENAYVSDLFRVMGSFHLETVTRQNMYEELIQAIGQMKKKGLFEEKETPDSGYVRVPVRTLQQTGHIAADIHIQLSSNSYSKLFRKNDDYDLVQLDRYFQKKGIEYFYILREQFGETVGKQIGGLTKLIEKSEVDPKEAREVTESALEMIQDLTSKIGFTPEVQALALKTVDLTVKMLGKNPNLSVILTDLKKNKGKYITSHSLMLAQIACASACRIGWKSGPTFVKLTLAAILHDLSIQDNELAKKQTIEEARAHCQSNSQDLISFKLHPANAAEYARKFHDIPPDVDTIIAQHHERPDGTGFPRKLFPNRISPLSCLFIISEDFLHFFLKKEEGATISEFVTECGGQYQLGVFKKIISALSTGVEISAEGKS